MKSVIRGDAVTVDTAPVRVGSVVDLHAPQVRLIRNGNDVTAIEVRCGCGEVMVLDCLYASSQSAASTSVPSATGCQS